VLGKLHRLRHFGAQRVGRKIEIDRSRLAALPERARHRLVELLQNERRLAHGARVTRQRPHEIGVRHVLQRAAILLRARRHAGEDQHRRARDVRVGDARHRVGDAGAGGDQRDAELASQLRVRVGHVDGGALVAHVDDANAFGIDAHPDRHDVAAAKAEYAVDAALAQETGNHASARVGRDLRRYQCHDSSCACDGAASEAGEPSRSRSEPEGRLRAIMMPVAERDKRGAPPTGNVGGGPWCGDSRCACLCEISG
jgi:hypothetical protein